MTISNWRLDQKFTGSLVRKFAQHKLKYSLSAVCLVLGIGLIVNGSYMMAKAQLAQAMVAYSWNKGLAEGSAQKPWFWADTQVAGRIRFLNQNQERYVMRDVSGESLAFGPGFIQGAIEPKSVQAQLADQPRANKIEQHHQNGVAIAGHRDSHFGVLKTLQAADVVELERLDQSVVRFRVVSTMIIDTRYQSLERPNSNELTLVTCYPFEAVIPGGPLRFVVLAQKENSELSKQAEVLAKARGKTNGESSVGHHQTEPKNAA